MNQYFCARHLGVRVYPFSSLERELRTLAPATRKEEADVRNAGRLLISYNAWSDDKLAWCFACEDFAAAVPLDAWQRRRLYQQRGLKRRRARRVA